MGKSGSLFSRARISVISTRTLIFSDQAEYQHLCCESSHIRLIRLTDHSAHLWCLHVWYWKIWCNQHRPEDLVCSVRSRLLVRPSGVFSHTWQICYLQLASLIPGGKKKEECPDPDNPASAAMRSNLEGWLASMARQKKIKASTYNRRKSDWFFTYNKSVLPMDGCCSRWNCASGGAWLFTGPWRPKR